MRAWNSFGAFRRQSRTACSGRDVRRLEVTGLLIPRYEYADDDHIVLKLKSGYNIGLEVSEIRALSVLSEDLRDKDTSRKFERLNSQSSYEHEKNCYSLAQAEPLPAE